MEKSYPTTIHASNGFVKATRSTVGFELLKKNPKAFNLLYVIAMRARWSTEFNHHDLHKGEAMIGDFKEYGMTEREYRTAKSVLEKYKFATFKATSRGTIAKLTSASVFDINIRLIDEQADGQATDARRPQDGQPTTNEEGVEGVEEEKRTDRLRSRAFCKPPSFFEVQTYFESLGLDYETAKKRAKKFYQRNERLGWQIYNWQAAANALNEDYAGDEAQ